MWIGHFTGPCWTHGNWRWLCVFPPCRLFDQCPGSFDFYYVTRSLLSEHMGSFGFLRFSQLWSAFPFVPFPFPLLFSLFPLLSFSPSLYLSIRIYVYCNHSGPIWSLLCTREIQCRVKLLAPNSYLITFQLLHMLFVCLCCVFFCSLIILRSSSALLQSLTSLGIWL